MTFSNGQSTAVNRLIDYLIGRPIPNGAMPTARGATADLALLAESAYRQIMCGGRTVDAEMAIAAVEQLRADLAQMRAERDRLLMKLEPDRIIAPMRLDELEQLGSGAIP